VASGELDDLPLPANSGVPDLIIRDSIRDCATAELAKLVSTIESEIASDKTLADLQKKAGHSKSIGKSAFLRLCSFPKAALESGRAAIPCMQQQQTQLRLAPAATREYSALPLRCRRMSLWPPQRSG